VGLDELELLEEHEGRSGGELGGPSIEELVKRATDRKAAMAETVSTPGMVHNQLRFAVARPCLDCYITSFTPDLVYADGTRATMDTGAMLHHFVLTSQFNRDATCGSTWLGLAGERFFASGDERTAIAFEPGYGYRVRWYDSWNLLVDLMNHSTNAITVYVQVTYTYRPSWESVKRLKPVWLDIDQCGDSEYSIPGGVLAYNYWDWSVNVPGMVIAALGHVHGHGVAVEAANQNQGGASICRSTATLHPNDVHRVARDDDLQRRPARAHPAGRNSAAQQLVLQRSCG
jgi:hypothetical protein